MEPADQARLQEALDESTWPLLLSARQAAALCGRSVRTWRTWHTSGRVPQPVRIGRCMYWRRCELVAWVEAGCPKRDVWQAMHKFPAVGRKTAQQVA